MSTTTRFLSVLTAFALSCATLHAQSADAALDAFRAGAWTKVLDAVKAVPADAADRPKALYLEGETYLVVARPDLAYLDIALLVHLFHQTELCYV